MALICPITREVMVYPVIAADGHTYEERAIAQVMAASPAGFHSPMTQAYFASKKLIPNHFVKSLIAEYVDKGSEEVKAEWKANLAEIAAARKGSDAEQVFQDGKVAEAAALGHRGALTKLAYEALDAEEYEACVQHAQMLNDAGHKVGAYILGQMYYRVQNAECARPWLLECAAEFPNAYYLLGRLAEDPEKWFLKGCRSEDVDCMYAVAELSCAQLKYSVARRMFKKVMATENSRKYDAMFQLGGLCIQDKGGTGEYVKGQQLVWGAAEGGHPRALALRALNLAFF